MIWIVLGVVAVMVLFFTALMFFRSTPLTRDKALASIQNTVDSSIGKGHVTNAVVYIDSPKCGISEVFTAGQLDGYPIKPEQPFHIASIGKTFTATLIGCLMDEHKLLIDDKIAMFLDESILKGLFEYQGVDYSDKVTVKQLLNHTSGIADYFGDKVIGTKPMKDWVLENTEKLWTPQELIAFSRDYQKCAGAPGRKFHYSDTGYILLGLIIESISGKSFDAMLEEKIFTPLNMNDSYLMFYNHPKDNNLPIADVWFEGVNIKNYASLSLDWAGGGIVSTARDLSRFIRALNNHEIISEATLKILYSFDEKFMAGIHYGCGFMEYHFGEFFPTMRSYPNYIGHMGVLGTQMFYSNSTDTVYISSFGSSDYADGSVKKMIEIISILMRIEEV